MLKEGNCRQAVLACVVAVVCSFVQPKRIVSSAQAKHLGGQTRLLTLSADDSIFPLSIPNQRCEKRSRLPNIYKIIVGNEVLCVV
jgi:hypothetical protein